LSPDYVEVTGKITDILPGTKFKVELENGRYIIGHLSGKMRQNFIKILPGDLVTVEITKYDLTKGRITFRGKKINYPNKGDQ
jgi:translation initiation factor IF-1